jgi:hypothetical protein
VTITPREAEAALLLYRRGLRAGDRALVRRANAALRAYLRQAEDGGRAASCGCRTLRNTSRGEGHAIQT